MDPTSIVTLSQEAKGYQESLAKVEQRSLQPHWLKN